MSGGAAAKAGFVGWYSGVPSQPPLDLKTDKGIGIGSTAGALKAAYGGDVSVTHGEQGFGFSITAASGIMLGQLDGGTDASKIKNIQAGSFCGL